MLCNTVLSQGCMVGFNSHNCPRLGSSYRDFLFRNDPLYMYSSPMTLTATSQVKLPCRSAHHDKMLHPSATCHSLSFIKFCTSHTFRFISRKRRNYLRKNATYYRNVSSSQNSRELKTKAFYRMDCEAPPGAV